MKFKKLVSLLTEEVVPTSDDTRDSIIQKIEMAGWKFLGSGAYGKVFEHPDKNYVLKLYNDKGYSRYVEFLKDHSDNPHVVKIKEILSSGFGPGNDLKLIAIEKLKPLEISDWKDYIIKYYSSFLKNRLENQDDFYGSIENFENWFIEKSNDDVEYYKNQNHRKSYKTATSSKRRLGFFIENHLDLFRIIFDLNKFREDDMYLDLHSGNFMIRPSTGEIVVTDPLC